MKTQKRDWNGTNRLCLALAVGLAVAASASAQSTVANAVVPLEPGSGDGTRQAYGLLDWQTTEGFFAKISGVPDHAKEYLQLHRIVDTPTNAHWAKALDRLNAIGDAFTLTLLSRLKDRPDCPMPCPVLVSIAKIQERLATARTNPPPAELLARLERAALADVTCHYLESTLVPWALASVRPQMGRPEVRSALEKAADYQPSSNEVGGFGGAFRARVAEYARRLLKSR